MKKKSITLVLAMSMTFGLFNQSRASEAWLLHQDKNITELIQQLERQFNVKFNYESKLKHLKIKNDFNTTKLEKDQIISYIQKVSMHQIQIEKIGIDSYVLKLKKTNNSSANQFLSKSQTTIVSQQIIEGVVVDANSGEKLRGVTIRIKGTNEVTQTDNEGSFKLNNVTQQPILLISAIGYQAIEVVAGNHEIYKLTKAEEILEEVVVTALGIKREQKALGYAVQEIKGDQLQRVKGVDVGTTLTGRISGLRVQNSTEFNRTPSISLRGMTPLLVIDGIAYENLTLRDIPVDNIENITTLKGATAAALYGNSGAGGAIMVTTKKGLSGRGTEITVNSNNMFFAGYLALPEVQSQYSAGEGGKYNTNDYVWGDKLDIGRKYSQWNPISKSMEEVELTSRGKNNFQNFLEPGVISNNTVSFTNQGEFGSIRTTVSHIYNKGQYPNAKLNMTNISVSGDTKISDKINLESRFGYNRRYAPNDFGSGYGAQGYIYNILVWTGPEYDLSQYKDYWITPDVKQNWHYNAWYDNPYLSAYEKISSELINKLNAAVTLNYQMTDWAKLMFRSGYDFYANTQEQTNPKGIYGTRGGFSGYHSNGKYWSNKEDGYSTTNDVILNINKSVGDFTIDGLAGGALVYQRKNGLVASTVNGISIPGFYSLRNSVDPISGTENKTKEMINSLYGRLSIGWRNALFLEATGRNDWSSTLTAEHRSFFYPSLSGSAVLTELFPSIKPSWLNLLKLRGSWAVTKVVPQPYEIRQTFSVNSNVWDGMATASYPNSIKDYSISPTQRDLTEIGVDFSALNNRIYGNYTRYYRLLHNVTTYATISSASGFSSRLINTNEERITKGHEITLGGTVIKKNDFQWDVITNISQNLEYFNKLDSTYSADALFVKKGMRTDYYATRDWERSPNGAIVHNSAGMPISATHANLLFGYSSPKWFWGFTNQFRYKSFDLSFSLDGRVKGLSYSNMNARLWQTGAHPDAATQERYEEVVNGNLTFVGDGVKLVSGAVTYDKYGQIISDTREFAANDKAVSFENYWKRAYSGTRNIWDETFIKLREVSINYNLSPEVANRFKAKRASVGVTGQNLLLWTKEYKYSDPDSGAEDLNSPSMRYVGFNLNVSF